jgi:hypothetical protein
MQGNNFAPKKNDDFKDNLCDNLEVNLHNSAHLKSNTDQLELSMADEEYYFDEYMQAQEDSIAKSPG